jgi:hypothetical protein
VTGAKGGLPGGEEICVQIGGRDLVQLPLPHPACEPAQLWAPAGERLSGLVTALQICEKRLDERVQPIRASFTCH